MTHPILRFSLLAVITCFAQTCRSIEAKPTVKPIDMVSCDSMSTCQNRQLNELVTATQDNARRGAAYLKRIQASDARTFEHITRILVLNDLDYAQTIGTLSLSQNTNPDVAASDVSRLLSHSNKGAASGLGTLILLTPISPPGTASQVTLLSTLKENGLVGTAPNGAPILSQSVLWGSVAGDASYLGWDLYSLAHSQGTSSKLEHAAATAAKYTEESKDELTHLNAQDRERVLVAFEGLLKEIRLDYKHDFPKSGSAYAMLTELKHAPESDNEE